MALPTFGSLSIKDAAGTARSIAREVDGNVTGNKSLRSLSSTAGKTSCMHAFYGYASPTLTLNPISLDFDAIALSQSVSVTVSAGNSWFATADQTWIIISSGSGTESGSFSVRPSTNGGTTVRLGVITVESSAPDEWVLVSQSPDFFNM